MEHRQALFRYAGLLAVAPVGRIILTAHAGAPGVPYAHRAGRRGDKATGAGAGGGRGGVAMSSFLERYERGEHERVWDELLALGAAVWEGPLYADALAVARETMRRVRHNVELLVPRLRSLGFAFGYE